MVCVEITKRRHMLRRATQQDDNFVFDLFMIQIVELLCYVKLGFSAALPPTAMSLTNFLGRWAYYRGLPGMWVDESQQSLCVVMMMRSIFLWR